MTPEVSVILTTYNGASRGYLVSAIESVLHQSFINFELLIIDDGSSDDTKARCNAYLQNGRVRYIFQENEGLAGARNTGIQAATAEWICFIDDDDVWKAEKLQMQIDFVKNRLANKEGWGLVFTWLELIDEAGNIIGYRGHQEEGWIYKRLFFGNTIDSPSSVLVKREVFEHVGLFDMSFQRCQDWDMWLRIAKNYLIFPVKQYLVQYREHKNRLSSGNEEVFLHEKAVLEKALASAPPYIKAKDVYGSCYINRGIAHFASNEFQQFREKLINGAKLSPRSVSLEHVLLLGMSFFGREANRHLKKDKVTYTTKDGWSG